MQTAYHFIEAGANHSAGVRKRDKILKFFETFLGILIVTELEWIQVLQIGF